MKSDWLRADTKGVARSRPGKSEKRVSAGGKVYTASSTLYYTPPKGVLQYFKPAVLVRSKEVILMCYLDYTEQQTWK